MDTVHPPPCVVVIAASSGGVAALLELVPRLPGDLPASVLIASHTPPFGRRRLPDLLSMAGPLPATHALEGQALEGGRILVAPPDRHLVVEGARVHLTSGAKEHRMRPAADVLFRSAAVAFGARSIGMVLSGGGHDGTAGLTAIRAAGGLTLVQSPHDARLATMPLSALAALNPDACAPARELGALVARFARERAAAEPGTARAVASPGDPPRASAPLSGLRVLVAEDEYLIASELLGMLEALGCEAVGPVADVDAGLRVLEQEAGRIDCAVLDVDLQGEKVFPLAVRLEERALPLVFTTGYGQAVLSGAWAHIPRVQKPYDVHSLGGALRSALRPRGTSSPVARPSSLPIDPTAELIKDSRNLIMRARMLRTASPESGLTRTWEAIRRTQERIDRSALRVTAARHVLRGRGASETRESEEDDAEGS